MTQAISQQRKTYCFNKAVETGVPVAEQRAGQKGLFEGD